MNLRQIGIEPDSVPDILAVEVLLMKKHRAALRLPQVKNAHRIHVFQIVLRGIRQKLHDRDRMNLIA